jgi:hypothetical protein
MPIFVAGHVWVGEPMADATGQGDEPGPAAGQSADRWERRVVLATAIEALTIVVPLLASYLAVRLLLVFVGNASWPLAAQMLAALVAALGVGIAVDRLMRRLLPLAALLRMTMLFPDPCSEPDASGQARWQRAGASRDTRVRRGQRRGCFRRTGADAHRRARSA